MNFQHQNGWGSKRPTFYLCYAFLSPFPPQPHRSVSVQRRTEGERKGKGSGVFGQGCGIAVAPVPKVKRKKGGGGREWVGIAKKVASGQGVLIYIFSFQHNFLFLPQGACIFKPIQKHPERPNPIQFIFPGVIAQEYNKDKKIKQIHNFKMYEQKRKISLFSLIQIILSNLKLYSS